MNKELDFLGFPGYRIWDDGRIESCWKFSGYTRIHFLSKEWKELKPGLNKGGYLQLRLKGNMTKIYTIHKLVALAFIPNPNNLPWVLHNNDIKIDNRIENLRWGTAKDNTQDCIKNGNSYRGIGEENPSNKLSVSQVIEIKKLIREGKLTQQKIANIFNISREIISAIKTNRLWKHINE